MAENKSKKSESGRIKVRRWKKSDIPEIVACHVAAYPDYKEKDLYNETHYQLQQKMFPEGQCLAEIDGKIVGYATCLIVDIEEDNYQYSYREITGGATFNTHDPAADTLYGADIAVHPDYRGRGVAAKLYSYRKKIVSKYNLRRMVAFGRIPGYKQVAGKMTANEYVEKVIAGELNDYALSAHLKAGYSVKTVLLDHCVDQSSLNYATLLQWNNPDYDYDKRRIAAMPTKRPVSRVRVCSAQFQMRRIKTWDEFQQTVEFFVDSADAYHCHFLVMPEYFTSQLICTMPPDISFEQAVENLSDLTDRYREMFSYYAKKHQLYIIGGSHPTKRDGQLYNVSHFFAPSGKVYTQDKLHITPSERDEWMVRPGEGIKIFDTPVGRIAIQICYDIEFPEVSRLLGLAGVEIIFVPFLTDERKGFNRVRYTAQARAVENYCYVVISGNVGNLPTIKNSLINYGQSSVFTPSDFAFPREAIAGQAEPNVETVVICDLDLATLAHQRIGGSVRPFFDRRPDLYSLEALQSIEVVKVD